MPIGRLKMWRNTYGFFDAGEAEYFAHVSQFIGCSPRVGEFYNFELGDSERNAGEKIAVAIRSKAAPDASRANEVNKAWAEHAASPAAPIRMGDDMPEWADDRNLTAKE